MNRFTNNKDYNYFIHEEDEDFIHPDIKGQKDFSRKVKTILNKRRRDRENKEYLSSNPKAAKAIDFFNKSVIKKRPVGEDINEAHMTEKDKKREKQLKKKYDDSAMKQSMIDQYGPEKGPKIYFATIRKQAMKEDLESGEEVLDEAKLSRAQRRASNVGKRGYDKQGRPVPKGAVHAFDVDETLFGHGKKGRPNVKVHVKDEKGNRVKSLTNQEFNAHKLEPGHSFDFSEFSSAKKFSQTASPNKSVIGKIKKLQKRGKNVHLITARDKFDNPEEFRQHFERHGIRLKPNQIHYTGGMKGGDIGQKKVAVAKGLAKKGDTKKIHMYDDAAKVHKAFEAEKKNEPGLKIKTHLAKPNKRGEVMLRSYQATKEDFDLWMNSLLAEGYDLSNYSLEDLCGIYVNELLEDYEINESIFESPYTSLLNDRNVSPKESEEELAPYDYWKKFINERDDVDLDEECEEEEGIEVNYEPTSYDIWKNYLSEKYINETQQEEQTEDEQPAKTNAVQSATYRQEQLARQKRRQKLIGSLEDAQRELGANA